MESRHFINTGELLELSEQQCVDCDWYAWGCWGGFQDTCMYYARRESKALRLATDYPYTGVRGRCAVSRWGRAQDPPMPEGKVRSSGYIQYIPRKQSAALKAAIEVQPVTVTVSASADSFRSYTTGILNDADCFVWWDHTLIAVGWGNDAVAGDYYILKNSWGADWGDAGYIKVAATETGKGICGVQGRSLYVDTAAVGV